MMLITSLGCSQYPVSGKIEMKGSNKRAVLYLIDPIHFGSLISSHSGKVIDSARVEVDGNFKFEKMPECKDKKMFLLAIQNLDNPYPSKLEHDGQESGNYLPFVYQSNKSISIKTTANHLLTDAIIDDNIPENKDISKLIKTRKGLLDKISTVKDHANESSLMEYEKSVYHFQKEMASSVTQNNNVLINALMLRWVSPVGDYERIPEIVKETCQKLLSSDPNHPWTIQICQKSKTLPLTPGDEFPNFPMPMSDRDTVDLFKMLGSKLTLIDMWASWCAPCRNENKTTLVPLWDNFHEKGFQIIGYALDSSEKGWKNAITKDGADRWLHASHLEGDVSPLFKQLKITTIPSNYLLDNKGNILAKNLHGDELADWVKQYLK